MLDLPSNVKQELMKVTPASIASETLSFVFFDNHPLSQKPLDITLCTSRGEIVELHNRHIINSLVLEHNLKPSKISIYRTKECHLHYLIQASQEVFIIRSDSELSLVKKLDNIDSFHLRDDQCTGEAVIQLKCIDDAVPIYLDDKFQVFNEPACRLRLGEALGSSYSNDESSPIRIELKRKLNSTQYNVAHNENLLKDHMEFRYNVAFNNFQEMHNGIFDAANRKCDLKSVADVLKLKLGSPWIKLFGHHIVIILDIFNENELELEDIQILLQTSNNILIYKTKLYESSDMAPFWLEIKSKLIIKPDKRTSVVLCMEMASLQNHLDTNFEIVGFIMYKLNGLERMLPFESVKISTLNILRNELSLISNELDKYDILAILATSKRTDLIFCHMKENTIDKDIDFIDILCHNLDLEAVVGNSRNMLLHKSSPYHVFHGLLIVIKEGTELGVRIEASVYFRTSTQILALIHAMHDLVPHRIIILTPKHTIISKNSTKELHNEKPEPKLEILNINGYATSLVRQLDIVKDNYDQCIVKMNESKDEQIKSVIGEKINLMACGVKGFNEFKLNFESEVESGIKRLNEIVLKDSLERSNSMFMDTDGY